MGYEHYLFAAYVFLLVCIVILICKHLFSDTKRQKKTLEEMEMKLLRTYETLEDAIDEFYSLAQESMAELKKKHIEIKESISSFSPPPQDEKEPVKDSDFVVASKPKTKQSEPKLKPKAPPEDQPVFEQLLNETAESFNYPVSPLFENVQALEVQGKSRAEIAKELKITQNAVDLVLGMSKIKEDK